MYFYQYKFITFWTPPQKNHSKYATDIPVPTIFGFSVLGNNIKIPVYTLIVQFYNFSYQKNTNPVDQILIISIFLQYVYFPNNNQRI